MKKTSIIFVLLLLCAGISFGQKTVNIEPSKSKPFVLGTVDELWSRTLSEKRVLNIYLPDGYNNDSNANKIYPVIYLLDGSADEDFIHVAGIVQFLSMITEAMPPAIVVGIANVDRRRDFTFPTTVEKDKKDYPTTGGSEKFLLFVERDLQPYIKSKYRVNKSRTVIGQSLGGLLATEPLLEKPWLFDNYVIVSPSLWWDNESLLQRAPALIKAHFVRDVNVVLEVGAEEDIMVKDAHQLNELLEQQKNLDINVTFSQLPDENHLTILHNAVYKALVKLNNKK